LNYAKYFAKGEIKASGSEDYNSHNTQRLSFEETKELLLSLDFVRNELNNGNV